MNKSFLLLAAALVVFGASHVSFAQDEPAPADDTVVEAPAAPADDVVEVEEPSEEGDDVVVEDEGTTDEGSGVDVGEENGGDAADATPAEETAE